MQAQVLTEIRNKIVSMEGIPIVIFFAVREGKGNEEVRVKFTESQFSLTNPHLLGLCKGLIERREKQIKETVIKHPQING